MKKTYINPELEVIKIATQQMLADSTLSIDDSVEITNEGDLLSRESFDVFDDENVDYDNF
jgi:hypothetical protein